ncbi:hypothetical protein Vi05172_g553 [Venturia inaequalis]|nr:hypothetical protein Vi05172_g553 [Venturia inaequalis]
MSFGTFFGLLRSRNNNNSNTHRQPTLSERAEYEHSLQETVLLLSEQDADYDASWYRLR